MFVRWYKNCKDGELTSRIFCGEKKHPKHECYVTFFEKWNNKN